MLELWDLWFPTAGATGVSFCRSRVDAGAAGDRVLVHAAPPKLQVKVFSAESGALLAAGDDLERGAEGPMSFLVRNAGTITLEDGWPSQDDVGRIVLLPGGEAGVLCEWWHADDQSEWRWKVEFYNHK